jgi:putative RecB family exonuclease
MIHPTPDLETLPQRGNGLWDYVSPSRLNFWVKCPLAFKARYIDHIPSPTTPSLFIGKRVHAALEYWYRHRMLDLPIDPAEVLNQIDETWDAAVDSEDMTFKDAAEATRLQQQTRDLVHAYLGNISSEEPLPLAVESRWELPLIDPSTGEDLGLPLLGIVDLILDGRYGATIIDFKTAANASSPVEISHELQLTSYSYLWRTATGQEEIQLQIRSLVKTKNPTLTIHCFGPQQDRHFRRLFAVIREYLDALDCGCFNYRPGWTCGSCDYRQTVCAEWCG